MSTETRKDEAVADEFAEALRDLVERATGAVVSLTQLIRDTDDLKRISHLKSKREGVALVLGYIEEAREAAEASR